MFYLSDKTQDLSLGHSISGNSERLFRRGKGGQPGYIRVFATKDQVVGIKRLLSIKENQIYQVREFSAFLCMGRCKTWAHCNHAFDMHLSYLGPVSYVLSSWVSSGCTVVGVLQLRALSPSWVPSGLIIWAAVMWWLDGCNSLWLPIWQVTFCFHSIAPFEVAHTIPNSMILQLGISFTHSTKPCKMWCDADFRDDLIKASGFN